MSNCLKAVFSELADEYYESILKHGLWDGYSAVEIHKAVTDECREYTEAVIAADINGLHGQRRELLQLANVALKGYMRLAHVGNLRGAV